jgi:hypothetical protein
MTPTPADREHYAAILAETGAPEWICQDARDGIDDDDAAMGQIVRYRLAAEERGARMALEAAAKVADDYYENAGGSESYRNACRHVASTIRQIDPAIRALGAKP